VATGEDLLLTYIDTIGVGYPEIKAFTVHLSWSFNVRL
jgi:hypothetical protein